MVDQRKDHCALRYACCWNACICGGGRTPGGGPNACWGTNPRLTLNPGCWPPSSEWYAALGGPTMPFGCEKCVPPLRALRMAGSKKG